MTVRNDGPIFRLRRGRKRGTKKEKQREKGQIILEGKNPFGRSNTNHLTLMRKFETRGRKEKGEKSDARAKKQGTQGRQLTSSKGHLGDQIKSPRKAKESGDTKSFKGVKEGWLHRIPTN